MQCWCVGVLFIVFIVFLLFVGGIGKNYFYICIEMRIIISAIISITLTIVWYQAKKYDKEL
jgi:hypothetical protein